jgi:hypothetical protein
MVYEIQGTNLLINSETKFRHSELYEIHDTISHDRFNMIEILD